MVIMASGINRSWARAYDDDDDRVAQHGGYATANRLTGILHGSEECLIFLAGFLKKKIISNDSRG